MSKRLPQNPAFLPGSSQNPGLVQPFSAACPPLSTVHRFTRSSHTGFANDLECFLAR
jgi:hypothetical protein